jgi:hypothetical protein
MTHINLPPPPVLFIKSISEQGYSLHTAVADLIDNSIAAGSDRVEILIDSSVTPLCLFLCDNGKGMSGEQLTNNMRFPSADMDVPRDDADLGRFGLGLKTASFSQSRKFTVLSKVRYGDRDYEGRTWDVNYLKTTGEWTLLLCESKEINRHLEHRQTLSESFHQNDQAFIPSTVVVWESLYKLNKFKGKAEINDELSELVNHLSLVFHRFISSGNLTIRLNNLLVSPFNPFPTNITDVQNVSETFWQSPEGFIRFQGVILPKRAAAESKSEESIWNIPGKTLDDLQGIYVYRNNRLISYGLWMRSIAKSIYLQFGRVMIDISNSEDVLFHLNVAKASLKIPFALKRAMADCINKVSRQAMLEYRERMVNDVIKSKYPNKGMMLIERQMSSKGPLLKINSDFEIIKQLRGSLNETSLNQLDILFSLFEKKLNMIWDGGNSGKMINDELDDKEMRRISNAKLYYETSGYDQAEIMEWLMESYGSDSSKRDFIKKIFN